MGGVKGVREWEGWGRGRNRARDFGERLVVHERGKGSGTGRLEKDKGVQQRKGILNSEVPPLTSRLAIHVSHSEQRF